MFDPKMLALLEAVIEHYIDKGDPVGSKFLHSLDDIQQAPSTLRKYLNMLEKDGLVYQPYNSSGRIPTIQGLSAYLEHYMSEDVKPSDSVQFELDSIRSNLKNMVEALGNLVDGVVAGFIKNDEYYFLGINNLLKDELNPDFVEIREIARFIENKKIISLLDERMMQKSKIYYHFFEDEGVVISCLYCKIFVGGYDCILSIVGPSRVNYRKNLSILKGVMNSLV